MQRLGDYVIEAELPPTSHALVFVGTHVLLPRRARIQIAPPAFAIAMVREACILETLRCSGVPRVYECGVLVDRRPWTAIEHVDGPTIATLTDTQPLPVSAVLALLRDVATVLDHAHGRGVIHRNLRPEAISQNAHGLVVTQWGDARTHESEPGMTTDGLEYRAPELITGDSYDGRADVYALGVVAYDALALSLPLAVPLARRCPSLPARLCELIDRMIAVEPIARPSAAEVRAQAGRIADALAHGSAAVDDMIVEEVEVELVDIAGSVELAAIAPSAPAAAETRVRWTPADPYLPRTTPAPVGPGLPVRKRPT